MIEPPPEAIKLITYLNHGGAWGYYWHDKATAWFTAGQPGPLPAAANVYFGVHPSKERRGSNQRAVISGIAAANCLYAEFDAKDFEGDKGMALDHINSLPLPPSVLVDSGGGYHAYWLLAEPIALANEADRERIRKLQAAWVELVKGDPGAKDLARMLRVPGTLNTKYDPPRPVTVQYADFDMPYRLSELEAAIRAAGQNIDPKPAKSEPILQHRTPGDAADYWLGRALDQAAPGNRDHTGFWLGCQLRDSGVSEAEAKALPYPERVPKSSDPYTRREYERSIASAYSQPARDPAKGNGRYTAPAAGLSALPGLPEQKQPLTLQAIAEAESHNEAGDADLFAIMFSGSVCYDHAARAWHVWYGHYWQEDQTASIYGYVTKKLAAAYMRGAGDALEEDAKDLAARLSKRANQLQAKKRADNVIALSAAHPDIAITGEEWDSDPWRLGVENGVINLRTGEFRPGRPGDYLRAHAPTAWQGLDTPAPRFERFIGEIFNHDQPKADFIQRLLGYGLTGLTREHVLPVFYGPLGRNGKSTLLETLGHVLGPDLATSTQADAIMDISGHGDGPRPFVYALRGKRLVWASESNEGRRLNSGLVKQLTGGDRLNVRTLHSKPVEFEPSHLLLLITNHRPHIPADDDAIWDRVFLVPFTMRFVDRPSKPNELKADKALKDTLRAEAPGILAWLVRGCLAWQREGLQAPDSVRAATEEYRADEDTLARFIAECCVLSPGAKVRGGALYEAYENWTQDNALQPLNKNTFGQRMKQRFELVPPKNVVTYGGIGLKAEGLET